MEEGLLKIKKVRAVEGIPVSLTAVYQSEILAEGG
jgi:hypothetical protein